MKKMFFLYSFLFTLYSHAQNLVPNYSFEDTLQCPSNPGEINLAFPWYSPTSSSTDYFNECALAGYIGVPSNVWGYQSARTGKAYAEIGIYGSSSFSIRDYIQVQLTSSLITGKDYCINFYVSPAGVSGFSAYMPVMIDQIGLLLSTNPITTTNTLPLPYTPQIISPAGIFLSDTSQWMEISGTYTALGGEHYITIGNFKNDATTDTVRLLDNGMDPQGYYYVDDVSVTLCDTSGVGIAEQHIDYKISMYPNPSDGSITLNYHLSENEKGSLNIYDVTGKQIKQIILSPKATILNLNESALQAGIYYYSIIINNKPIKTEKIVIIK